MGHGMCLTRGVYGRGSNEASLTSDVFVACLFQPSWRGLAGLSPSASSGGGGGAIKRSFGRKMLAAGARLEFHVGWSGWTRLPATGGGGGGWGSPRANRSAKGGVGGF